MASGKVKFNKPIRATHGGLILDTTSKTNQLFKKIKLQEHDSFTTSSYNAFRLKNRLIAQEISGSHAFEKHILDKGEFRGWIRTRKQFSQHIENVLNKPNGNKRS